MSQSMFHSGESDRAGVVGARIRYARGERGITLRELAVRLGVSPATMSAVENGRTGINAERLADVAGILQITTEELLVPVSITHSADAQSAGVAPDSADWRYYEPLGLDAPLAAALDAFLRVGYHGATMRDIARRAQLSVPGLYHHYASKQDMLVSIFDIAVHELTHRCRLVQAETDDCVERFRLLVENLALYHTHRRELAFVGATEMRSLEEPGRSRILAGRSEIQRILDTEVQCGHDSGVFAVDDPREAARAVVTMCTGLTQWYSAGGAASAEEVARRYVGYAMGLVRYR